MESKACFRKQAKIEEGKDLENKKAERLDISDKTFGDVPRKGLEPSHLAAPDPKSGVSTNFTIWAGKKSIVYFKKGLVSTTTIRRYRRDAQKSLAL